ncbi:MAG: hypothetical protein V4850_19195 [Myxococcota bacterium]
MSENEDQKWARLQREREQNRPRNGGAIVREDADDPRLLHPANEGHDEERSRIRATKWAGQTVAGSGGGPPDFTSPRTPPRQSVPLEAAPEEKPRGLLHNADKHLREHQVGGGEAKKHPRPREETTPVPGAGRHREPGPLPGEPEIPPGATPIGAEVETKDDRDRLQPGSRRRPPHM